MPLDSYRVRLKVKTALIAGNRSTLVLRKCSEDTSEGFVEGSHKIRQVQTHVCHPEIERRTNKKRKN
jgi:hypothetical protein